MKVKNLLQLLELNLEDETRGVTFISNKQDQHITYNELRQKSLHILGGLQRKGIKTGSEIIILTNEVNVFVYMFWACIMGGFIPVPVSAGNTNEHKYKLLKIWKQMNDPFLFMDQKGSRILKSLSSIKGAVSLIKHIEDKTIYFEDVYGFAAAGKLHYANPKDIAMIQFSSGSTGEPKGVTLTHENLITNLEGIVEADPNHWAGDKFFSWMPLTHDLGLIGFHLAPIAAKIHQYLMPTNMFIRSPLSWLNKVQEYKATVLSSPNFGYKFLLDRFKNEGTDELDLSSVRKIVNGAEPISYDLTREFIEVLHPFGLRENVMVPSYGMAEAAVGVTFPVVNDGFLPIYIDRKTLKINSKIKRFSHYNPNAAVLVSLGKAIKGTSIRICNEDGKELGNNRVGRVQIQGNNVTSGYYNNSEATKQVMTKDGWLITGDLGFMNDGDLTITGREKDIIFINGQNYYPHDIERVAEHVEGIELGRIAVCGVLNEDLQKEDVIAFVLYRGPFEEFGSTCSQLKEHLNRELAIDLASVLPVKKIPRTTSGKVQRYLLAQQYEDGEFDELKERVDELLAWERSSRFIAAPRNKIEQELTEYFKKVLELNDVSIYDHFFEMGGNSLKASQILGLIFKKYSIEMTFEELFLLPTVHRLAAFIQSSENKSKYSPLASVEESSSYPITPMQRKIYFMERYEGIGTAYNVTASLKVTGRLSVDKAQSAFQMLIDRHESLRTNFVTEKGEIRQVVNKSIATEIVRIDPKDINNLQQVIIKPFDLAGEQLIRFGICELSTEDFILIFDVHHIVADRISMSLLINDFFNFYEGKDLFPLQVHYKDFSIWNDKSKEEPFFKEQENYWRSILEGELPVMEFPADYRRPKIQSFKGEVLPFSVNGSLLENLRMLAKETDTTLYMVLLSAFNVLLSKYTGQEDIIVGTPVSGRYHPDLESIIGMFVNTLPIRSFPESDKSYVNFLKETKIRILDALNHQSYPTEELLNELSYTKDPSRNPLFDMVFVMQNMNKSSFNNEGLDITEIPIKSRFSKFDLTLEAIETEDIIHFNVEYNSGLFKQNTVKRFINHFNNVLADITLHPQKKLADINMLSEEERSNVLFCFNDTAREFPEHKTIHQLIEEQADRSPDAQALFYKQQTMTYKELNKKANNLASYLVQKGIRNGDYVGVFLNRGFEMIIGVLGILKAGAAYVPLDPSLPKGRLDYIINSLQIKALVINDKQKRRAGELAGEHLSFFIDPNHVHDSLGSPSVSVTSDDNAYVIFTSGSTGMPNGVRVKHKSVVNLIDWFNREFKIGPADRVLFLTSLSFDLSVYDIFGILSAGGSIRIAGNDEQRNPLILLELIKNDPITLWDSAPAAFGQIVPFIQNGKAASNKLRHVFLSGDWIPLSTPQIISEAFPSAKLISLGGATEATVWSNFYKVDRVLPDWNSIPYGKPIQNAQYYILDKHLQPCPIGVPGELYIGGDCLSEGYINSPQLNNKRFLSNPFLDSKSARLYKTGDKAKWHEDGNIEFLGRLDFQVKIRGYRIELGEIQSVLSMHKKVKEAHVLMIENSNEEKSLCAYILSEERINPSEFRGFLAERVPEYMIPSYFVVLEKLPVTLNGKLDRKALPDPDSSIDLGQQYEPPNNRTEEILVNIWEELLGIKGIGINDNFFALGGDSIKAIQAAARLDNYNLKMDINDIFKFPTIAAISRQVKQNARDIDQGAVKGDINLTPVQNWFFAQKFKDKHHFNQAFLIKSKSGFETEKVQLVFDRLLEHHDALRIGINKTKEGIKLFNHDLEVKSPKVILYDLTEENEPEGLISKEAEQLQKEIDLSHPPFLKLAQFNSKDGAYLLMIIHHLIIDGVSWRILFEDFVKGYKSALSGQEINFPPKMDSFQTWSNQLDIYSKSLTLENEIPYWRKISNCMEAALPKDINSHNNKNNSSETIEFYLDEIYTENLLTKSSQAFNTGVETILLTALSLAIYEWTKKAAVSINLEGHGRINITKDLKIDRTVGWFTSMYPVLLEFDPYKSKGYQIKQIKELLIKVPNGGIGYGLLKYSSHSIAGEFNNDMNPEISFNYLGQFNREIDGKAITLSYLPLGDMVSPEANRPYSLNINCYVKDDQFVMMLEYSSNEYLSQTMNMLTNLYKKHLIELIDYCTNADQELTPSDLTFSGFDIEELESFIQEVAVGLADEE